MRVVSLPMCTTLVLFGPRIVYVSIPPRLQQLFELFVAQHEARSDDDWHALIPSSVTFYSMPLNLPASFSLAAVAWPARLHTLTLHAFPALTDAQLQYLPPTLAVLVLEQLQQITTLRLLGCAASLQSLTIVCCDNLRSLHVAMPAVTYFEAKAVRRLYRWSEYMPRCIIARLLNCPNAAMPEINCSLEQLLALGVANWSYQRIFSLPKLRRATLDGHPSCWPRDLVQYMPEGSKIAVRLDDNYSFRKFATGPLRTDITLRRSRDAVGLANRFKPWQNA